MSAPHTCIDMIPPGGARHLHNRGPVPMTRAISLRGKEWPTGTLLRVGFVGGTAYQHDMVMEHASEWLDHANIGFDWRKSGTTDVRIGFVEGDGAWSYLGTDNRMIPQHGRTMNFGWLDRETILHEFGHLLSLAHEHQSPLGDAIEWDRDAVIRELQGPPNNWSVADIEHNVLNAYAESQVRGTDFDPDSIMLYFFPDHWVRNGTGTRQNTEMSSLDKAFVRELYPGRLPPATRIAIGRRHRASISTPGEVDWYTFEVPDASTWRIQTRGKTDTLLTLYKGDRQTYWAQDNDSGWGQSSRIVMHLEPGTYFFSVQNLGLEETGDYKVGVREE